LLRVGSDQGGHNESEEDEEGDSETLVAESSASDHHSSDDDVPRALWLEEFKLARKTVKTKSLAGNLSTAQQQQQAKKRAGQRKDRVSIFNSTGTAARKVGKGAPAHDATCLLWQQLSWSAALSLLQEGGEHRMDVASATGNSPRQLHR
jgi:hypothetical protein